MEAQVFNLFVYGSLRSGFRNPAYTYLTQYFQFVGEAVVRGQLFDNGEYPVAVPAQNDHFINGELYALKDPNEFDWAIKQLDDYEGVDVEEGEHPQYARMLADAYINGEAHASWIYWYNMPISHMQSIETGDLLTYLQQKNKP